MNLYSIKNKFISFFLTSFSMSIVLAGCGGVPPDTWGTPNPDYLELVDVSSCWYGICPGQTTREDAEQILQSLPIGEENCHFTPYNVPVINGQDVPSIYGQSVPAINGQDVPLSTSLHLPTILPAQKENKPEATWQEKGKRSWTFMHSYNICGPETVTDVSNGSWELTAALHRNIENGLKNIAC